MPTLMCHNNAGSCAAWDATGGADRPLLFGADAVRPAFVPGDGVIALADVSGVRPEQVGDEDCTAAFLYQSNSALGPAAIGS